MAPAAVEQMAAWARGVRASDARAFTALYDALHAPLWRYAHSIVRDEEAGYDVLQEAFTRLWEMRERVDPDRSVRALLFTIVRNLAYKHVRRTRGREVLDDRAHDVLPALHVQNGAAERLDADRLETLVQHWIDEMPPRRRETFVLSRVHDLSHREVAAVLGVSPRTVNNHIVEALRHLRRRLDEYPILYRSS